MGGALHLSRRFLGSLVARRPDDRELAWVRAQLSATEWGLWQELSRADRRHSLTVARDVERRLRHTPHLEDSRWIAAALLHDVGKVEAGLGTVPRVGATLLAGVVGRARVRGWADRRGALGRAGRYLCHPELGAQRLRAVAARDETVAWAAVHHGGDPRGVLASATVPEVVADALRAADDD